jgi:hypothetical protein
MDNHAQEMVGLLREQNQLLKKHLWRLRFSLFSLLLLTTLSCITLGYLTYRTHVSSPPSLPAAFAQVQPTLPNVYQTYPPPSPYSGETTLPSATLIDPEANSVQK